MRASQSRSGSGWIVRTMAAPMAMLLMAGIAAGPAHGAGPGSDVDRAAQLYEHVLRETAGDRALSGVPTLLRFRQAQLCCEYPESMH
jgi:hypothetical protein